MIGLELYAGGIKFYVEVKADSHTARKKHHNYLSPQLKRYLEVIDTIEHKYAEAKSKMGALNSKEQKMKAKTDARLRMAAVEITDPSGWIELFGQRPLKTSKVSTGSTPSGGASSSGAPSGVASPATAPVPTRSTIGEYAKDNFWLFIGGQRFSPATLGIIDAHVQGHIAWIDPSKFPAPSAFAGVALPDLSLCY